MDGQRNEQRERVPYSIQHTLPRTTLIWATLAITLVMAGLYAVLGFPVTLAGTYYQSMYFHSIGIGLAAIAVYLVVGSFDLESDEPRIDFPLSVRAFVAVLFATGGGIIYLFPALDSALPDFGLGMYIVAFLLLADVGGALYVELMLMPRKRFGLYNPNAGYWRRMFPFTKEMRGAYKGLGPAYWLAMATVGSAFIAGLIGFVYLWVALFGTSVFTPLVNYLGIDAAGFLDATLDPHSHQMALAIMVGIVAIAAQQYGIVDALSGIKKNMARAGLWIATIGVIAFTVVFLDIAFNNFSPATLFPNGNANGIAGDDMTMTMAAIGAMVLVIPMALAKLGSASKPFWRDSVHLTMIGSWVLAVVVNVISGFYVEMNEDTFQTTSLANDTAFAQLQSLFGIFVLASVALVMLSIDQAGVSPRWRSNIGRAMGIGTLVATAGGLAWAFSDPSSTGLMFSVHLIGLGLIGVAGTLTATSILRSRIHAAAAIRTPAAENPAPSV